MRDFILAVIEAFKAMLSIKNEPPRDYVDLTDVDKKYSIPEIVTVKGVRYKKRGKYRTKTGTARGLVVHYTVSGKTARSAKGVVNYLAKKNLGCMVMDEDGIIYVPEDFNFASDVAYHAGDSHWRGVSGISRYCMGMEICSLGRLTSKNQHKAERVRTSPGNKNIVAGKYEAYTPEQEESLKNFILWRLDVDPEFSIDWVVGHDEIAPKRKFDPGASLSKTMPEYRDMIRSLRRS